MHPRTRHRILLENKSVSRWFDDLSAKSSQTAEVYLRNLGLWLERIDCTPDSAIQLAKSDLNTFENRIEDRVRGLEKEGRTGSYIATSLKPLISYLKKYHVEFKINFNIKGENDNPTVEDQIPPTKEELNKVLRRASPKNRTAIALIAFTGMRPRVIGNKEGDDGLRIKDLPELTLSGGVPHFETEGKPALINVRKEISKNHGKYATFLSQQGMTYLLEYLELRLRQGERLTAESPLVVPDGSGRTHTHEFLETVLLLRGIKETIKKCGFNWRPYIFKNFYSASMDMAENKGIIGHSLRQFLMGHKGSITDNYARKGLTTDQVEDYRSIYMKCEKYLNTVEVGNPEADEMAMQKFVWKSLLKLSGYTDVEIEQMNLAQMKEEDVYSQAQERMGKSNNHANNAAGQELIGIDEVKIYLSRGYKFVNNLGNGEVIMEKP